MYAPEHVTTIHVLYNSITQMEVTCWNATYTLQYSTLYHMQDATVVPLKCDPWELLGSQFTVGTKLGEGNYGVVYKGTLSMGGSTISVQKHMDKMTQEGKNPYTVAIKLLKGLPAVL